MNEIRDLIVGIDFSKESSQIAYYDRKAGEPVSVTEVVGSQHYEIETKLCRRTDQRAGYCVGQEAVYFAKEKGAILIENLYELCESEASVEVGNEAEEPYRLAARFFEGLLGMLGASDAVRNTRCVVVTVPELSSIQVRNLSRALEEIGFLREEYMLMDYAQSFYFYAMTQRRENWNRNIGWFAFHKDDVTFHRLSVRANLTPVLVRLATEGSTNLPAAARARDNAFGEFSRRMMGEELYSTIFLTGDGFSTEWSVESSKALCGQQRKVFYGNNLFAKGACAAGKERKEDNRLRLYRFLSDSMVLTNVGMEMRVMGAPAYYSLIEAGSNWYEYHPSCEFLLDGVEELVFVVGKAGDSEKRKVAMQLPGLPDRPPKTTRLQLQMEYASKEECIVTVRDLGFGEFYPSSQKTWKEAIRWWQEPQETGQAEVM